MKDQILYILAFKDEPLVKVGLAANVHIRSRALGSGRFDFKESYLVRSKNKPCIRTLERNLKTFYAPHQTSSSKPILSGNTETFDSSILPGMLKSIDTFRSMFPHADFQVEHDISSLIPAPRQRKSGTPGILGVRRESSPERTKLLLSEVESWCKANGVSQKDLAARMAISPQRLNDMMTGRRNTQPTGEQVLQLLEILKTKPARKKKSE